MFRVPPSPRLASALISAGDRFRSASAALSTCSVWWVARCSASTVPGSPVSDITKMDYPEVEYRAQLTRNGCNWHGTGLAARLTRHGHAHAPSSLLAPGLRR